MYFIYFFLNYNCKAVKTNEIKDNVNRFIVNDCNRYESNMLNKRVLFLIYAALKYVLLGKTVKYVLINLTVSFLSLES